MKELAEENQPPKAASPMMAFFCRRVNAEYADPVSADEPSASIILFGGDAKE